jgi:hypothetical protein
MEDMRIRNKNSKLSLKSKILLAGLALLVIVGLGAATRAALENADNRNEPSFGQMTFFDPFALTRVTLPAGSGSAVRISSGSRSRPAIRTPLPQPSNFNWTPIVWVPIRPPLRSPLKPRPGS